MKNIFLSLLILNLFNNIFSAGFTEVISNLRILESYIKEYKEEKNSEESLTHLVTCYIREGRYKDITWTIAAGTCPKDLATYISQKDTEKGTNASACRTYADTDLPTNERTDFVHLFAVINGIEFSNSYTEGTSGLVGWAGDLTELISDIKKCEGEVDELYNEAKKYFMNKSGFDLGDYVADLDAPVFLSKKNDDTTFTEIIENFYSTHEFKNREKEFVRLTFPTVTDRTDKDEFREIIFDRYYNDSFIKLLEIKYSVSSGYDNHRKAAIYVFADYLYDKIKN